MKLWPLAVLLFCSSLALGQNCFNSYGANHWPPAGCVPYAASSPFNTRVPPNPKLLSNSAGIVSRVINDWVSLGGAHYANSILQASYSIAPGGDCNDAIFWGESTDPVNTITSTTCPNESQLWGKTLHIPTAARPAGDIGFGGCSDHHITLIDKPTAIAYDMYQAFPHGGVSGGNIPDGSGGNSDRHCGATNILTGSALDDHVNAGHTASAAGMIRGPELQGNLINHALFLTVTCDNGTKNYPADAGVSYVNSYTCSNTTNAPPLGAHFWLDYTDAQIAALAIPTWEKTIVTALAHYGGYVLDQQGPNTKAYLANISIESGETYEAYSATQPIASVAAGAGISFNAGLSSSGGYIFALAGIDYATHLHVLDPCIAQNTCNGSGTSVTNTYYVSTSGSDANNGSQSAPWRTISHADQALVVGSAGALVNVAVGTYPEPIVTNKAGSAGAPIRYQCATQWGCHLTESTSNIIWAVGLAGSGAGRYTQVVGFDFDGTGHTAVNYAIVFYGTDGLLQGNKLHDTASSCFTSQNAVAASAQNPPIVGHGTHYSKNLFYHNNCGAGHINGAGNAQSALSMDAYDVADGNVILDHGSGYAVQVDHGCANCLGFPHYGTNATFTNNTVCNVDQGVVLGYMDNVTDYDTVTNNIVCNVAGGTQQGIRIHGPCGSHEVVQNNLIYGVSTQYLVDGSPTCGVVISGTQTGSNSGTFVNYTGKFGGDMHQASTSKGIGTGSSVCAIAGCVPATDFDGTVMSSPPPIGAYSATSSVSGANYYVASTGNNANNGTTASTPWQTLNYADTHLTLASSGNTTVHVASCPTSAFCYGPSINLGANGNASQRIIWQSDVKWGAKINGVVNLYGSYVDFKNFELENLVGNGASNNLDGITTILNSGTPIYGKYQNITGNKVHDVFFSTSQGSGSGECAGNSGINIASKSHDVVVDSNIINRVGKWGGCPLGGGGDDGTGSHGIYVSGYHNTITNNRVSNAAGYGIEQYHNPCENVLANNTLFHNFTGGIQVAGLDGAGGTPCVTTPGSNDYTAVNNNLVVDNGFCPLCPQTSHIHAGILFGSSGGGSTGSHNKAFNNMLANNLDESGSQENSIRTYAGNTAPSEGGTVSQTSMSGIFVDYQDDGITGDYHLTSGSPAIGAGTRGTTNCAASPGISPCIPTVDSEGSAESNPISIGAFTYLGTGGGTTPPPPPPPPGLLPPAAVTAVPQ
jgi:parallel beta-helix repeat protein